MRDDGGMGLVEEMGFSGVIDPVGRGSLRQNDIMSLIGQEGGWVMRRFGPVIRYGTTPRWSRSLALGPFSASPMQEHGVSRVIGTRDRRGADLRTAP